MAVSNSFFESTGKNRVTQIFQFLRAFYALRTKTILQIADQPWIQWLRDIPDHESVWIANEADLQQLTISPGEMDDDAGIDDAQDDLSDKNYDLLLTIRRPILHQAPEPPLELAAWLEEGWDDPANSASYIIEIQVSPESLGEGEEEEASIFFDDDPNRVIAWAEWIERRDSWAKTETPARVVNRIYERVFALHRELEREPESLELILGDGFLVSKATRGDDVEHPILFQKVEIRFDAQLAEFELAQADSPLELYDTLLQSVGVSPDVIRQIEQDLVMGEFHPLFTDSTDRFLERSVRSMSARGEFVGDGRPVRNLGDIRVGREPVLFLRRRSGGFARAIENVLTDLESTDHVPESLKRIIGDFDSQSDQSNDLDASGLTASELERLDLFLTKPATREQIDIATLLDRDGQVVVQGPPGTGKTHTIGNIIGHLLAQGKRVLVTSHTTKALEEVRDAVDGHLRPLCVSMLGGDRRHKAELQQAVDQITARLTQINEVELDRQISYLSETRERQAGDLSNVREQLVHAIGDEYRPIDCFGQQRNPVEAAKYVNERSSLDAWVPDRPGLDENLPMTPTEFETLYSTNASVPPDYETDLEATLPDPDKFVSPKEFSELTSELSNLDLLNLGESGQYWNQANPLARDHQYLSELLRRLRSTTSSFLNYPAGSWQENLLQVGYRESQRNTSTSTALFIAWDGLIQMVDQVAEVREKSSASFLQYGPSIPDGYLNDDSLTLLSEISIHLASGRKLSRLTLLRHPRWKSLIRACQTNGHEPKTGDEFESLMLVVELAIEERRLQDRWRRHIDDARFNSLDISNQQDSVGRAIEYSHQIRSFLFWHRDQWKPMEKELMDSGIEVLQIKRSTAPPNAMEDSDRFTLLKNLATEILPKSIDEQLNGIKRETIVSAFDRMLAHLPETTTSNDDATIANRLREAIVLRDTDAFQESSARLRDAYSKRDAFGLRATLLGKLRGTAPKWSEAIRNRDGVHGATTPPGAPQDGWIWAQLDTEIERRLLESVPELQDLSVRVEHRLQETTAELADAKAWLALKENLTSNQLQALNGWRQLQSRIGKGTGIRAPSLRREARKLMPQCQSAVPVWIMPLTTLVETFDPAAAEKFDCLIIDEASQVDVMGLIPWYMADQVLVVGDDQQVTPEDVGAEQQPVDDLINQYLKDIPVSGLYDGRASIYQLASVSFDKRVRLIDHFRCVEPIIKFSSELCYDGDLNCLRDINDASVGPPTIELNVKGFKHNDLNEREAVTIASLMMSCIEQPEYAGLSFGMISMLGRSRQHQRVQELLMRHLDPKIYEDRKILCGTPPHFQGGERDVMFISIVDSPNPDGGPLSRRGDGAREVFRKRFNVAASRAKDQMWVVHSLEPGYDLHGYDEDLRSRLITHARNASELPSRMERLEKRTRSPFEDAVAERLLTAGYEVEAAWMVGKLEIDLVVTGENGEKLAIECDGEQFHPPEKLSEDLARQRILQNWGWRFERIRGSAFYRDETSAMAPVFSRLEKLNIYPRAKSEADSPHQDYPHQELRQRVETRAQELRDNWDNDGEFSAEQYHAIDEARLESQSSPTTEAISKSPAISRTRSSLEEYQIADLRAVDVGNSIQHANTSELRRLIVEVTTREGPVHQDIVLKRIREKYGIRKLRGSTREIVINEISRAVLDGTVGRVDKFMCIDPVQFSNPPRKRGDREITEISQRELTKAVDAVRTLLPSLQRDDLIQEIKNQLGYTRYGPKIKAVLEDLVD